MTNLTNNGPVQTLRDGSLKASIWGNRTEKGTFYSVDLVRSYTDEAGQWHDTRSLSSGELLRGARLFEKAYDEVQLLRAADKSSGEASP